jgi:hypothetical protein
MADEAIWKWSQTAMDVIRKQNEAEAKMAPILKAIRVEASEASEALWRRLITEGTVFTQNGEVVDVRLPEGAPADPAQ